MTIFKKLGFFPKKEKRIFSDTENAEIYSACEEIRSWLYINCRIGGEHIINDRMFRETSSHSLIYEDIKEERWDSLFNDIFWLRYVRTYYNNNPDSVKISLLKKYFNKEVSKDLVLKPRYERIKEKGLSILPQ